MVLVARYPDGPAASKACSREAKRRKRTTFEPSSSQTPKKSRSVLTPLALPVPACRKDEHHRTTRVDAFAGLDRVVGPGSEPVAKEPPHSLMAVIDARRRQPARRCVLDDFRIEVIVRHVATRREAPSELHYDLHVPRHSRVEYLASRPFKGRREDFPSPCGVPALEVGAARSRLGRAGPVSPARADCRNARTASRLALRALVSAPSENLGSLRTVPFSCGLGRPPLCRWQWHSSVLFKDRLVGLHCCRCCEPGC